MGPTEHSPSTLSEPSTDGAGASASTARRPAGPTGLRAIAAVSATGASLALWALAGALGIDVVTPAMGGNPPTPIGAGLVIAVAAGASLAAWALAALLDRLRPGRAAGVWTLAAVLALVLSMGGPLGGAGIDPSTRVVLAAAHVLVAAVLIPAFRRTWR